MSKSKRNQTIKTIKGILIANSWDKKGNPTVLKLCSKIEKDYLLSDESIALDYGNLSGKSVIARGEIKKVDGFNILIVHELVEQLDI